MKNSTFSLLLLTLILRSVCSAAEFKNLGFDEADTSDLLRPDGVRPQGSGVATKILPGWKLLFGSTPQNTLYVNESFDPNFEYATLMDYQASGGFAEDALGFAGGFALRLERAKPDSPSWILEQIGTVPSDAQFLIYRLWFSEMQVRVNGEVISPLNRQDPDPGGFKMLAYDISVFAGRDVKLELAGPYGPPFFPDIGGVSYIDSIAFLGKEPKIRGIVSVQYGKTNYTGVTFYPNPGKNTVVEFRDDLATGTWQTLPGAPHNSGSVTDTNTAPQRSYRLRIANP